MPRALSQILEELNQVYNPQRDVYNSRITALPEEQAAEERGLEAAKRDAFDQITTQANRRGLFYSGIPVAEEQRYTGQTFLPAVANMRANFANRRFNLQDALAQITQRQYGQAYDIRNAEEQNEIAARGGSGGASPSFGFGGGVLGANAQATMSQRANKGFDFRDAAGNPISAAQFAAAKGIPFRRLLQEMANRGDSGARTALGFVGDDYGYDPGRIGNNAALYNALVWGTGRRAAPFSGAFASGGLKPLSGGQGLTGAPAGVRF